MFNDYFSIFRIRSKIPVFSRIFQMVIELFASVLVPDVTPAFCANGMVHEAMGGGGHVFPFCLRIQEKRFEAWPLYVLGNGEPGQVAEGWVDTQEIDWFPA